MFVGKSFFNKQSGKFSNHLDLKKFTNIHITYDLILYLTCPRPYLFSYLLKFVWPFIHISTEHCLVKFSQRPTVPEGTDNTTFTLCSVSPNDFLKFKCTAWLFARFYVRTVYTSSAILRA
jgi:hypothetical protein